MAIIMYVVKHFILFTHQSVSHSLPRSDNGDLYLCCGNRIYLLSKYINYLEIFFLLPRPLCIVISYYFYIVTVIRLEFVHMWCNTEHSKPGLVLIVIVKLLIIIMEFHLTCLAFALSNNSVSYTF